MSRAQYWVLTVLAAVCLALAVANTGLSSMNRGLQAEVGQRQQYVQQSLQLESLYREIIRALAELGARNNDQAVQALLQRHGISYTVNAAAAAAAANPAQGGAARKESDGRKDKP